MYLGITVQEDQDRQVSGIKKVYFGSTLRVREAILPPKNRPTRQPMYGKGFRPMPKCSILPTLPPKDFPRGDLAYEEPARPEQI